MHAVRDAVKLWCNSNLYLTSDRRKNVLKATDPAFIQLLQDKSLFQADERNKLFGSTFYNAIVKSCQDDEARRRARPLANRGRGGRRANNNSRSWGRHRNSHWHGLQPAEQRQSLQYISLKPSVKAEERSLAPVGGRNARM